MGNTGLGHWRGDGEGLQLSIKLQLTIFVPLTAYRNVGIHGQVFMSSARLILCNKA